MSVRCLTDWLDQLSANPSGPADLEPVRLVAARLGILNPASIKFVVAGTNGKGSTCELIERLALAAGLRVGKATSPHILAFNERIQIDGTPVTDEAICRAFGTIESACRGTVLNYFQFGALAALLIFKQQAVDVVVLEVGLGGRLDAMNAVDADVSVITSIGLDHQAVLGDTREAIAREKAGIMRSGQVCIVADPDPPESLEAYGRQVGARLRRIGTDFDIIGSHLTLGDREIECPGEPRLHPQNAAAAAAAVVAAGITLEDSVLGAVLARTNLTGRVQVLQRSPDVLVDVAHNVDAVVSLAQTLIRKPAGAHVRAVVGMYRDKLRSDVFNGLLTLVDEWYVTDMEEARAAKGSEIAGILIGHGCTVHPYAKISTAYNSALKSSTNEDMIVAFGSFPLVAGVLRASTGNQTMDSA